MRGVETEIQRISVILKNMRHDYFAFNKVSVPYGCGKFCFHFPFWFVWIFLFLVSFKDLILKASPTSCSTPGSIIVIGGLDPCSEIFPSWQRKGKDRLPVMCPLLPGVLPLVELCWRGEGIRRANRNALCFSRGAIIHSSCLLSVRPGVGKVRAS